MLYFLGFAFFIGIAWAILKSLGAIRPDPGTPKEQEQFKTRGNGLIFIHWAVWLVIGLGLFTLVDAWSVNGSGIFIPFIAVAAFAPAALTAGIQNLKMEGSPKTRVVKSQGKAQGFWKAWDERNSIPDDRAKDVEAWFKKMGLK